MTTRTIIAATLLAGATLTGALAATAASETGAGQRAAAEAAIAGKALRKHKPAVAVAAAEQAVALQPRNAAYRTLLGEAYLAAGRFQSAAGALVDAVALDPSDGAAALHLALAQIATGDWAAARDTLTLHEATIAAADRGLALALAGDPASAVNILSDAARRSDADAKTRQNLALALALAGRWQEAKTVAAFDVTPEDLDGRIMQWVAFAKPQRASDQVATLLGVVAVEDGGQPERLALRTAAPGVAALAQAVAPADAFMPSLPTGGSAASDDGKETAPAEVAATSVVAPKPAVGVVFAPRAEIVQAVPVAAPRAPVKAVVAQARPVSAAPAPIAAGKGKFVVQLGAFESAGVAKDAWSRLSHRHRLLAAYAPTGTQFAARGANFYRLSISGFARGDADRLCSRIRVGGGKCFVRVAAGDSVAGWSRPKAVQLAAR